MNNYNPQALPDMTVHQASHIMSTRYGTYPLSVRGQAAAIMKAEQERHSKNNQKLLENMKTSTKP